MLIMSLYNLPVFGFQRLASLLPDYQVVSSYVCEVTWLIVYLVALVTWQLVLCLHLAVLLPALDT